MTAPLCRWCGKPIAKRTVSHWFGQGSQEGSGYWINHAERPKTVDEAQRFVNGQIVSVRRRGYGGAAGEISSVGVWDGESYRDDDFHADTCARAFGYAMAEKFPTWGGPGWIYATKELAT